MRIAVLFDGAGLARLGLEQSGHDCTGFEIDPHKHHLSQFVGSGNCVLADVTTVDLSGYEGIWASPPCQKFSGARTQGEPVSKYAGDFLEWALDLQYQYPDKTIWIENVVPFNDIMKGNYEKADWGTPYNAAQFLYKPIQNRPRIIGGNHPLPRVYRPYRYNYCSKLRICPTISASEHKGCKTDERRASRFYGRCLTLNECAYHMGFTIPHQWYDVPEWYTPPKGRGKKTGWKYNLYEAIGNGVPVYMAKAFGDALNQPGTYIPPDPLEDIEYAAVLV